MFSFYVRLNKRLSKQWRCRWLETPSRSLWRHCNGMSVSHGVVLVTSVYHQNRGKRTSACHPSHSRILRSSTVINMSRLRQNDSRFVNNIFVRIFSNTEPLGKSLYRNKSLKIVPKGSVKQGLSVYVVKVTVQERIQDLKLGVAQMDWKSWKPGGGGGGGGATFYSIYIYIKYDIFQIRFLEQYSIS